MLEVLVRDTCGNEIGKTPSSRFCYEKMGFCCETPLVEHLPNGMTRVSVCLFETTNEILGAVGEELQSGERSKFERIWTDDAYPRTFERQGDCLLIRGNFQKATGFGSGQQGSLRQAMHESGNLVASLTRP